MPIKFFTATATDNDKREAEACRSALTPESNLSRWWERYVNSFTWFGFVRSYRTKQLTQCIHTFQKTITTIIDDHEQRRQDALQRLYSQAKHWKTQHQLLRLSSRRSLQVGLLIDWIEQQLTCDSPNQTVASQHQDWLLQKNAAFDKTHAQTHQITPCQSDQGLYEWWRSISKLKFYQFRSQATKDLDKALQCYCNSVRLDRKKTLTNILIATECWKQERSGKSQRLEAVHLLEQQIRCNLEYLERHRHSSEWPVPWQASFATVVCTLYQWCFELSSSLELELLFT